MDLQQLQRTLRYTFEELAWLRRAMTHASASGPGRPSNERLEFLGDAVAGMVVAVHLYQCFPELSEGEMTVIRSAVVSRRTMARVARAMALPDHLAVDRGLSGQQDYPRSMAANVYEAVVGAIFADGGLAPAREFVMSTLGPEVEKALEDRHRRDYKSILQRRTQAEGKGVPQYKVLQCRGPDHERTYETVVMIGGKRRGTGRGPTKKAAEQNAARAALKRCYPEWEQERQ